MNGTSSQSNWSGITGFGPNLRFVTPTITGSGTFDYLTITAQGITGVVAGLTVGNKTSGQTGEVAFFGDKIINGFTGLTIGALYYVSVDTPTAITPSAVTNYKVGRAISPTSIVVELD